MPCAKKFCVLVVDVTLKNTHFEDDHVDKIIKIIIVCIIYYAHSLLIIIINELIKLINWIPGINKI